MKAARFSAARLAFSFSWPVASARSDVAGWQPCISKEEVHATRTAQRGRSDFTRIPGRLPAQQSEPGASTAGHRGGKHHGELPLKALGELDLGQPALLPGPARGAQSEGFSDFLQRFGGVHRPAKRPAQPPILSGQTVCEHPLPRRCGGEG